MAIIKHIASKNSHYSDSFKYLIYKHDEFTNEPLLDEFGNMILRDEYLIDALNVTAPETFAAECIITNDKYKQNRYRQDIKSHHYIISFDPKDVTDNGLTVSMAQNIGMDFAARNFPGHEALIATHADGHNNSGNIHIHIVINSVRKNDVEMQPFMERASDSKAGYKHHLTNSYSDYIKKDLMNVCQEHGLYQVDLLNPSRNRITDAEYWKKRREISKGNTHFKTELDYLRDKISKVTSSSKDLKEFKDTLFFEYGITLYEKRGRYSYLLPDKSIPITGRRLGTDYEKEHIILSFGQIKEQPDIARIPVAALIDIDGNSKAQSNIYYKRALELKNIENLARMANVITNEHIRYSDSKGS